MCVLLSCSGVGGVGQGGGPGFSRMHMEMNEAGHKRAEAVTHTDSTVSSVGREHEQQ